VRGKVGYVEQEPYIYPGTIRENILFGTDYNVKWYEEVI
jgi:ATP-binding cassette, subfamily C (CFTR/MRP), member 4